MASDCPFPSDDKHKCVIVSYFDIQRIQQELWYPNELGPEEAAAYAKDLLLGLHEEVAELQRAADRSRYHLLTESRRADPVKVTEETVDAFKYLLALLLHLKIDPCTWCRAVHEKGYRVREKWRAEQVRLGEGTKVLVTDLDGVIADMLAHPMSEAFTQQVQEGNPESARKRAADIAEAYRSGMFGELPVMEGAVDVLSRLRLQLGLKVVILTARPVSDHPSLHIQTVEWLKKNQVPHDLLLFDRDKWAAINRRIYPASVVAAVDDMPREVWELARHGVPTVVFDQPYNQGVEGPGIIRLKGWNKIEEHIISRVKPEEGEWISRR